MTRYPQIVKLVYETPWAILPSMYDTIRELVRFRVEGGRLSDEDIQARLTAAGPGHPKTARGGAVAVLPLYGVIAQRMDMMTEISGGTSTDRFTEMFRQAIGEPSVGAVVIDVDSPGGSAYGIQELAETIMAARGQKPIIAVANSMAASAAYWIASAADEVVITPSGEVGSIGVVAGHLDISAQQEMKGEKVTLISAGEKKTDHSPFGPLSDSARADIQGRVDEYYNAFVSAVAKGRGVSVAQVRSGFGEGGMVGAREALQLGMVDRIGTLDQTIARLVGRSPRGIQAAGQSVIEPVASLAAAATDGAVVEPNDLDVRVRRLRLVS